MNYRKLRVAMIALSGLILVAAGTVIASPDDDGSKMGLALAAYICGFPALIVFATTLGMHAVIEWPWRFSVRMLLVVLTLTAITLGMVAWVVK